MKLRTGLAALTIGAAATLTPLAAIPAASAAPADSEPPAATESGQELSYYTWFYDVDSCMRYGWAGYYAGAWYPDWICYNNAGYWELWVNYL